MSQASIKKLMAKANALSGKILGREFSVYRPTSLDDAMSDANFIRKQYAMFTLSKGQTSQQPEGFRSFIAYTDHLNLQSGDIFSDGEEVYVVAHNRGLEDVVAIRASDIVTIERAGWATTGGLAPVRSTVARNVPASVIGTGSSGGQRLSNLDTSAPTLRWEVRLLADKADVKPTDNIKLSDETMLRVDQVSHTELFVLLLCTEVKV